MKNLIYCVFALFCMLFWGACSSSDDEKMSEEGILKSQIAGEWSYVEDSSICVLSFSPNGTGSSTIYRYTNSEWLKFEGNTQYTLSGNYMKMQLFSNPYFEGAIAVTDSCLTFVEKDSASAVKFSKYDGQDATLDKLKKEIEEKYAVPYEAVDLGLPSGTKWANMNVGAESPEDYGDYFAWGETEPKSSYDWDNYLSSLGGSMSIYQDCGTEKDPLRDYVCPNNKSIAGTDYDVAHVKWGGSWTLPTRTQVEELCNSEYTISECTTMNDVRGYKFTSKKNGNSIFFPAAGYRFGSNLFGENFNGVYMSATPYSEYASNGCNLSFNSINVGWGNSGRSYGRSVRPVSD